MNGLPGKHSVSAPPDPADNFNGDDTFTYTVSDGENSAIGTVTITVHSVNDPPQIQQAGSLAVVIDEDNAPRS